MVKNVILQFDKDSDNSKIEVVQNLNKCPQLSHMDAESSHDRRRVILSRLGAPGPSCLWAESTGICLRSTCARAQSCQRNQDIEPPTQPMSYSPACGQCRVARLFSFLYLRQNHRLRSSQPQPMLGCREKERKQDATRDNWRMRVECSDL